MDYDIACLQKVETFYDLVKVCVSEYIRTIFYTVDFFYVIHNFENIIGTIMFCKKNLEEFPEGCEFYHSIKINKRKKTWELCDNGFEELQSSRLDLNDAYMIITLVKADLYLLTKQQYINELCNTHFTNKEVIPYQKEKVKDGMGKNEDIGKLHY